MKKTLLILIAIVAGWISTSAQTKSLHQLQQEFVDLRFGMFVHFGLPTFQEADWTDPQLSPEVFNPTKLDTDQWVRVAKSAGAKFICVSVKHHAGFCMWNTATTDYSVMNTPLHRDVLKELTQSLQKEGMEVMYHFSILDTHHGIRPTLPFTPEKTAFIKEQLREILTGYGPVNTLMFDGWDAPWGRISYEDISFQEIYDYVKSLQPNCLVMDLNGAKYPQEALFYSDIRCYEQGAGQTISASSNHLPAMACYPLQRTWFWKEEFPSAQLKDVDAIVRDNIIPYNNAYCTYILNAAPNRDGLIDDNAAAAMARIGQIWKNTGHIVDVPEAPAPITQNNLAIGRPCDSSWSDDMMIMDFANDDNFSSAWVSSPQVKEPWWSVTLAPGTPVGIVTVTELQAGVLEAFQVELLHDGVWTPIEATEERAGRVHILRFPQRLATAVRIRFQKWTGELAIAEVGVYPGAAPPDVKTTFQSHQPWKPTIDVRADAVMAYGVNETLEDRLASWKERGYDTHFMTGIAWGGYQDYFTGRWDGKPHMDEGQMNAKGDTLWHGKTVPYIVPTENYLKYFKEQIIKRVIDAGVDHIFLEEPEFWKAAGYSDAFKREWKAYYGTPWRPQHESPEATYLTSKLKYHLYYRALDKAFTYAKEYGRSLGRIIKCYAPTQSLINYTQWQIVSPEASLASMKSMDGYIAQVWTGTSRVPNFYNGIRKERVFETAFLEYGCMVSMTAPTGRSLWLLTDPIEDGVRDWEDYRKNYQATFTAQLLYPQVANYEIMPWPARIYERLYPVSPGSSEMSKIPASYATMMQVMTNALQQMPQAPERKADISVLMANSLMFQRDSTLSDFFGLAMPLLKRGTPVGISHIENLGYPKALDGTRLLLMSYANMKPLDPEAHKHLAEWVSRGGKLLYCGTDSDPFQQVQEWWNTDHNHYAAPADHLFELMGIPASAPAGTYSFGQGTVCILRQDPKDFVWTKGGEKPLLKAVERLLGPLKVTNALVQERGPYLIAAVLDESQKAPLVLKNSYIDLYGPNLPVLREVKLRPGQQGLFYDLSQAGKAPKILAAASRAYDEKSNENSFSYVCKGPADTFNVTRILLPAKPAAVTVDGQKWEFDWDAGSKTVFLRFPNNPDGVDVTLTW